MRNLLSIRRAVPLDQLDEYHALWDEVRRVTAQHGGHAWLFRAATREDHFLEFIEWDTGAALPDTAAFADALAALDRFGRGTAEPWEEAPPLEADP